MERTTLAYILKDIPDNFCQFLQLAAHKHTSQASSKDDCLRIVAVCRLLIKVNIRNHSRESDGQTPINLVRQPFQRSIRTVMARLRSLIRPSLISPQNIGLPVVSTLKIHLIHPKMLPDVGSGGGSSRISLNVYVSEVFSI